MHSELSCSLMNTFDTQKKCSTPSKYHHEYTGFDLIKHVCKSEFRMQLHVCFEF